MAKNDQKDAKNRQGEEMKVVMAVNMDDKPPEEPKADQNPTLGEAPADAGWFKCVHGGPMIDPRTNLTYVGDHAQFSVRTGWLQSQIEAGKMVQCDPPEGE